MGNVTKTPRTSRIFRSFHTRPSRPRPQPARAVAETASSLSVELDDGSDAFSSGRQLLAPTASAVEALHRGAADGLGDFDRAAGADAALRLFLGAGAAEDVGAAGAADRRREDQLGHREEAHVGDEGFRRVPADDRAVDEVVGDAGDAGEAVLDPVDHRLLGLLAVEIRVAVAVGALALARAFARLADPRIGQRLLAVEGVLTLLQVQRDPALAVARPAGDFGAELVRQVDLDATDRVDQVFESGEVDDRDVVDLDVEELFHRLDLQRGAAVGEGGVDFRRLVAGDFGKRVARDREFVEGAAAGPDHHQRVGAVFALRARRVRRLALFLL